MNVLQGPLRPSREADMESFLPEFSDTCIERQTGFIGVHDLRNGFGWRDPHQKMTMVRHDDKSIEIKRTDCADAVQTIDGLPRERRILEERRAIDGIRGDHHDPVIADRVALRHAMTLAHPSAGADRGQHRKIA